MSYVIVGSKGRMGQSIIKILKQNKISYIEVYRDQGLDLINPSQAKAVIDFSSIDFFNEVLDWSTNNSVPFVGGTTGLSKEQFNKLELSAEKIPVLWAPNMSIGVAFVNKLLKQYKELSDDFDFQITESHHNKKVDKPSGTGILLQETLKGAVGNQVPEVLSIRGGGIYGVHKILAMSEDEVITLEHQAINREVFAQGAIKCAKWLVNQPSGLYNVESMLG